MDRALAESVAMACLETAAWPSDGRDLLRGSALSARRRPMSAGPGGSAALVHAAGAEIVVGSSTRWPPACRWWCWSRPAQAVDERRPLQLQGFRVVREPFDVRDTRREGEWPARAVAPSSAAGATAAGGETRESSRTVRWGSPACSPPGRDRESSRPRRSSPFTEAAVPSGRSARRPHRISGRADAVAGRPGGGALHGVNCVYAPRPAPSPPILALPSIGACIKAEER